MAIKTQTHLFQGQVGAIDCAIDWPDQLIKGWALCLHPHPLFDGTRDNKVNTTFARTCAQTGLVAFRPNFRGVGQSEGIFDESYGETQDMLLLIEQIQAQFPELTDLPWVLSGFSFGTCVGGQVYTQLKRQSKTLPVGVLWAGLAMWKFTQEEVEMPPLEELLLIHGQKDEVIDFDETMAWVAAHQQPVVVIPESGHFFHGHLLTLKRLAQEKLKLWLG